MAVNEEVKVVLDWRCAISLDEIAGEVRTQVAGSACDEEIHVEVILPTLMSKIL